MLKKPITDPPGCTENLLAMNDTLEILGGKWKLLILHYIMQRETTHNTFKKMQKDITGISAKMLSKELKDLEVNQLIKRAVQNTKPITVEYSVTEYGKSTKTLIDNLVDWGKNHRVKMFNSSLNSEIDK